MTADDLTRLWTGVLQGDHKAWHELVRHLAALVYTVARRAGLPELDAEDCAQHTWLTLYRKRRSVRDPIAIPAWLIRTTHREAARMAQDLHRQSIPHTEARLDEASPLPDDEISSLEFQVTLRKALDELDPRCRKLITEMYLSKPDKKYREIAAAIGVKPNSFGPLRKRCLIKLRGILEKMGYPLD